MDWLSNKVWVLLVLLTGCSVVGYIDEVPYSYIEIYRLEEGKYHIRLPYRVEGRGNPHDIFEYDKYGYDAAKWLIVESISGEIVLSDEAKIGQCPFKDDLYSSSRVSGKLLFSENTATLHLMPPFDKFNRSYVIEFPKTSYKNARNPSAMKCSL
ncbi:hypothetical protein [Thalassotalea fusca]